MADAQIQQTIAMSREYFRDGNNGDIPPWLSGDVLAIPFNPTLEGAYFSHHDEFVLDNELGELAESLEQQTPPRIELLAWYTSFRNLNWGVYIREFGIELLASVLYPALKDPALSREVAFNVLLEHELTHFRIDATIAGAELLAQKSIYRDWRLRVGPWPKWSNIEEGFCNSHMLDVAPIECRQILADWMFHAPDGYKDFGSHKRSAAGRLESWSRLFTEISPDVANAAVGFLSRTKKLAATPQIYLVRDPSKASNGVIPFRLIGALKVIETEEFRKSLKKSGDTTRLTQKWSKAKAQIESGVRTPGLNLEQFSQDVFTVRLNSQIRAIVRILGTGVAEVVSVSQQHDAINKSARTLIG